MKSIDIIPGARILQGLPLMRAGFLIVWSAINLIGVTLGSVHAFHVVADPNEAWNRI